MLVVAEALREVLQECAAIGHIDELHAATDSEHGKVALDRAPHERDLEAVALGNGVNSLEMRLLAVCGGVDVDAARQYETVEQNQRPRARSHRCSSGGSITATPPARCAAST